MFEFDGRGSSFLDLQRGNKKDSIFGMYFVSNPKIKNDYIINNITDISNSLSDAKTIYGKWNGKKYPVFISPDEKTRFTPWRYNFAQERLSGKEFEKHPYALASYGKEGASKLAEIAALHNKEVIIGFGGNSVPRYLASSGFKSWQPKEVLFINKGYFSDREKYYCLGVVDKELVKKGMSGEIQNKKICRLQKK